MTNFLFFVDGGMKFQGGGSVVGLKMFSYVGGLKNSGRKAKSFTQKFSLLIFVLSVNQSC